MSWECIFGWISDNYPMLFIIIVVAVVVWKASKFYHERFVSLETKCNNNSKNVESLPCKKHEDEYNEIKRDLQYIKGTLDNMRYPSPSTDLAQSHSPLSLTEKGLAAADKVGADKMIDENWNIISNLLNKEICDKNAYDIQQYCIRTAAIELEKLIGEDGVRKMKDFAYAEGKSLQDVSIIIALKVRDRFFKENDINVLEVDENDPTRK